MARQLQLGDFVPDSVVTDEFEPDEFHATLCVAPQHK